MARTEGDLRCICRHEPLLGRYGLDSKGHLYVHVKVFKGGRIFGEMYFTEGTVRIRCRECKRWFTVKIRQPNMVKPDFTAENLPSALVAGQKIS